MYDLTELEQRIQPLMSEKRFVHCLGVRDEAVKLANFYHADVQKAAVAGLLHDVAKDFPLETMLDYCKQYGVELDLVTRSEPKLIHALLGAHYIKNELGIDDPEIFDAVLNHTTGKRNMPLLTKLIYIADYTERNRHYEGVDEIRRLSYEDLDLAILIGLNFTIQRMLQGDKMLHVQTVNARNDIILKRSGKP